MSYELMDLDRDILAIVAGLQFGKNRPRVKGGDPVVLSEGVPAAIVRAELGGSGSDRIDRDMVRAALEELTTRGLLDRAWQEHETWPHLEYKSPKGRIISTRIVRSFGIREVFSDGECVATEFDVYGGDQPQDPFACYCITPEGLGILDSGGMGDAGTSHEPSKRWEPPPGYVGTKTITSAERFWKGGKPLPQSTMQRWVKRSEKEGNPVNTVKAPDSTEKFYPEHWVHEQIKLWNPSQK